MGATFQSPQVGDRSRKKASNMLVNLLATLFQSLQVGDRSCKAEWDDAGNVAKSVSIPSSRGQVLQAHLR